VRVQAPACSSLIWRLPPIVVEIRPGEQVRFRKLEPLLLKMGE
jgi:hypothetical protein